MIHAELTDINPHMLKVILGTSVHVVGGGG